MFCKNCGCKIEENAVFCTGCGATVPVHIGGNNYVQNSNPYVEFSEYMPIRKKPLKSCAGFAPVSMIISILLIVGLYFVFRAIPCYWSPVLEPYIRDLLDTVPSIVVAYLFYAIATSKVEKAVKKQASLSPFVTIAFVFIWKLIGILFSFMHYDMYYIHLAGFFDDEKYEVSKTIFLIVFIVIMIISAILFTILSYVIVSKAFKAFDENTVDRI